MKILLIKLKNIGDTLIMTPVVAGIKQRYPQAHVAVLVRQGTEGILAGCKSIDEVFISAAPEKEKRGFSWWNDLRVLWDIRASRFDWVFELADNDRGRWMSIFSGGRHLITSSWGWVVPKHFLNTFSIFSQQNWQLVHRVEKDYRLVSEFLPLPAEIPPLVFDPLAVRDPLVASGRPYVLLHPVSRWKRKAWPVERWVSVGRALIAKGFDCIISSGPDPVEVALGQEITTALGEHAACTQGRRSWTELASLIAGARLFAGLDTAAMHLAAACQCPIVALFAQSIEHQWGPWKCPHEIIRPGGPLSPDFPAFIEAAAARSMLDIEEQEVIAACERMLVYSA
jgi:heptosyltransferase-3